MKIKINNRYLERYSRQIILKDVGILGQKKISNSKILIVGIGGLGSPAAELLARSGVGCLGIMDYDKVNLSNIHRQTLYTGQDVGKFKVLVAKKRLKLINKESKVIIHKIKANDKSIKKIINFYDIIIDGSDNFKTKLLLNKYSLKYKKKLIVGAISKFDGHLFSFDFKDKKTPCLKCFYQTIPSDENLNCETEGILGTTASIVGVFQANEALKLILGINNKLKSNILIFDFLNLNFRKVNFKKKNNCLC